VTVSVARPSCGRLLKKLRRVLAKEGRRCDDWLVESLWRLAYWLASESWSFIHTIAPMPFASVRSNDILAATYGESGGCVFIQRIRDEFGLEFGVRCRQTVKNRIFCLARRTPAILVRPYSLGSNHKKGGDNRDDMNSMMSFVFASMSSKAQGDQFPERERPAECAKPICSIVHGAGRVGGCVAGSYESFEAIAVYTGLGLPA